MVIFIARTAERRQESTGRREGTGLAKDLKMGLKLGSPWAYDNNHEAIGADILLFLCVRKSPRRVRVMQISSPELSFPKAS